ncbi:MAG: hypothetical protein ACXW3W_10065 [Pyrinomonadaceae bacterium]
MNPLDRGHELAVSVRLSANAQEKDDEKNADRHAQQPQNDIATLPRWSLKSRIALLRR